MCKIIDVYCIQFYMVFLLIQGTYLFSRFIYDGIWSNYMFMTAWQNTFKPHMAKLLHLL